MNNKVEKIEEMKEQLSLLGYHHVQIDHIIKGATGSYNIHGLAARQLSDIEDLLKSHIIFTKMCHFMVSSHNDNLWL